MKTFAGAESEVLVKSSNGRIAATNSVETGSGGRLVTATKYRLSSMKPWVVQYPDGSIQSNAYSPIAEWVWTPAVTMAVETVETFTGSADMRNGRKTVTWTHMNTMLMQQQDWVVNDGAALLMDEYRVLAMDGDQRPTVSVSYGGTNETVYGCCGVAQTVNEEGLVTDNAYDVLNRLTATASAGVTSSNVYDATGRRLATYRLGTNTAAMLVASNVYNVVGELVAEVDAVGNVTRHTNWTDTVNGWVYRRTTYPDGTYRLEQSYRDGQLYQVTGTAERGVRHVYRVEPDGSMVRRQIRLDASGNPTPEWTETWTDIAGRTTRTVRGDGVTVAQSFYDAQGRLWKQTDADGVSTLYGYNAAGEQTVTAVDMDRDDVMDYAGPDRIRETKTVIAQNSGMPVQRTVECVYGVEGATNWRETCLSGSDLESRI